MFSVKSIAFFLEINPFELQEAKNAVPSQNDIFDDQVRKLHEHGNQLSLKEN